MTHPDDEPGIDELIEMDEEELISNYEVVSELASEMLDTLTDHFEQEVRIALIVLAPGDQKFAVGNDREMVETIGHVFKTPRPGQMLH